MPETPIRVLLVEDNPRDQRFVEEILARSATPFTLETRARSPRAMARLREGGIDAAAARPLPPRQLPRRDLRARPWRRPAGADGGAERAQRRRAGPARGARRRPGLPQQARGDPGARRARPALRPRAPGLRRRAARERGALLPGGRRRQRRHLGLEPARPATPTSRRAGRRCWATAATTSGRASRSGSAASTRTTAALRRRALTAHIEGRQPHFEQEMRMLRKDGSHALGAGARPGGARPDGPAAAHGGVAVGHQRAQELRGAAPPRRLPRRAHRPRQPPALPRPPRPPR